MCSSLPLPARRASRNANGPLLSAETSTVVENARLCACCSESTSGWLFDRLRSPISDGCGGCVCGRRGTRDDTLWLRAPELSVRLRSTGTSDIDTDGVVRIPALVTGRPERDVRMEEGEWVEPTGDVGEGIASDELDSRNSRRGGEAGFAAISGAAAPAGGEGGELPLRSMPAISFKPTPKKRESFAARMRRTRKCGSEGCAVDGGSGRAVGEATGGDVGADTEVVAEPQRNIVWLAGGLGSKDSRIGEESGP